MRSKTERKSMGIEDIILDDRVRKWYYARTVARQLHRPHDQAAHQQIIANHLVATCRSLTGWPFKPPVTFRSRQELLPECLIPSGGVILRYHYLLDMSMSSYLVQEQRIRGKLPSWVRKLPTHNDSYQHRVPSIVRLTMDHSVEWLG